MKYNYRDFTHRIWEFNENRSLGLSTLSVYFYLLKIGSECGYTKFTVSDSQISRKLQMTRKTVKVCKEKLRRFGIISYQARNGVPSDFQLESDYPLIFDERTAIIDLDFRLNKLEEVEEISEETNPPEINQSQKKSKQIKTDIEIIKDIPTIEEFLNHAQSIGSYDDQLISEVKNKYENWINNDWKNNFDRPITNWKSALKNTLPYLKNNAHKDEISIQKIPNIFRVNTDHGKT